MDNELNIIRWLLEVINQEYQGRGEVLIRNATFEGILCCSLEQPQARC